ncbi:MAG: penicillin-binding protein 2 [Rickettsiales bacterium]|nr:penicillin-binding protein 2 [Rickettsiales bacterium]
MNRDIEEHKGFQKRIFILGLGKAILSSLIIGKLYYLQILNKSKFGKLSEDNRTKIKILYPERGIIFDQNNMRIAENRIDYQISLLKEKKSLIKKEIIKLQKILDVTEDDFFQLSKNMKRNTLDDFITIKKNLTWEELETFEYFSHQFPFMSITKEKVRSYDNNYAFSHVIGYVGYNSKIKNKKKSPDLKIGKTGIEKIYNTDLLGKEGWQKIESNSSGTIIRKLDTLKSKPGKNLKTYLNCNIQEYNYNLMKKTNGSMVLIDCKTGGVISMLSSPSFDINEFSYGIKSDSWRAYQNDPNKPLLNKSISGLYAPGSTFKLIVALYVLQNSFNLNQKYFCSGHTDLGNHKFHCWKRKGHGYVDLRQAIKESCDCFFYNLAKDINIDELAILANKFSIGNKTMIDLPNESSGLMPTVKWKKKNKNDSWHLGETYNAVIGQGFTLSTPLQLAIMTARIACGKNIYPKIKYDTNTQLNFSDLEIDKNSLDFVKDSMFGVVNEYKGTAFSSRLKSKRYKMAGKTGTSQVRRISLAERESGVIENKELPYKLRDHSIFSGFAPFKDPKLAISIILEHEGSGSKVAAPMARDILDNALKILNT